MDTDDIFRAKAPEIREQLKRGLCLQCGKTGIGPDHKHSKDDGCFSFVSNGECGIHISNENDPDSWQCMTCLNFFTGSCYVMGYNEGDSLCFECERAHYLDWGSID